MGARKLVTTTAGVLAGTLSGLFLADNALALASPEDNTVTVEGWRSTPVNKAARATILIPGMGNDGAYCFRPLHNLALSYGDVWTVSYRSGGVDLESMMNQLLAVFEYGKYDEVVLMLPSWAGVAGSRLLRQIREQGLTTPRLYPIFVCSVVSGNDALGPPLWLSKFVRGGPVMKLLWPLAVQASRREYDRQAYSNPEVDARLLAKHQQSMYHASPRIYIDQARALHQNKPLKEGEFRGVPAAILECNNDPLVRPEAALRQLRAFPLAGEIITVPDVGHADFVEHPGKDEGWWTTLKKVYDGFWS